DYSRPDAAWMPDDVAYGSGSARAGELRWKTGENNFLPRFVETTAAESNHFADRWTVPPGNEADAGALNSPNRPGHTIRTPTFEITTGKVFYLVKGNAQAYAAVSQHVMIEGPLHRRLVQSIKAGKDFQWVGHDLSAYKGLPAHVE